MRLLRVRSADLAAVGIRPFAVSLDTGWSQRAFAESLGGGVAVTMLYDRLGEAAAGFGVLGEALGMPRAERTAFLVDGDTVVAAWYLGRELPDVDAIIAAAA